MNKWNFIENAPLDGSEIDVWVTTEENPLGYRTPNVYWNARYQIWRGVGYHETPTHWMLPPSPPKIKKVKSEAKKVGALARAASLSPERRLEIALKANKARWNKKA